MRKSVGVGVCDWWNNVKENGAFEACVTSETGDLPSESICQSHLDKPTLSVVEVQNSLLELKPQIEHLLKFTFDGFSRIY